MTLPRKTAMKRGTKRLKRTELRKVSKKRRARDREMAKAYDVVDQRSDGRCEAQVTDWCLGYGTEHQHLYKRNVRPDQVTEPDSIINICTPCHQWVEANPAAAVELGAARFGWMNDPGPTKSVPRPY